MSEYTFCALLCAPIPVGHEVEASWFETPSGGFFGAKPKRVAHVRDLDTEVSYGEMECFKDIGAIRQEPTPLASRLRADLKVLEQKRGKVVSCQVATMGFSELFIQTTLVIDTSEE